MRVREKISKEELRHLYFDKHLTQQEIATHFGCGATTIKRRMLELGIEIRPQGRQPGARLDFRYSNPEWSAELAYVVGIIATDGNLSPDSRHIAIKSKDLDLLETVRRCLNLENTIGRERRLLSTYYRLQWGDVSFYNWLVHIGLTRAKSLTLGALEIPDEFFADFVRGVIDGDGSIGLYTDRSNIWKQEKYVYERLFITIASSSRLFLEWIHQRIQTQVPVRGAILDKSRLGRNPHWSLKFAKQDSTSLLNWIYYTSDLPRLERKYQRAVKYLSRG